MSDLAEAESRIDDIEAAMADHDKRDSEQFADIKKSLIDVRDDISSLSRTITSALLGEGESPGIKERLRTLEKSEINRIWWFRVVWAAIIGEGIVIFFKIFTKGAA